MSDFGIPMAAGITGTLSAAGLSAADVHRWFGTPRRELPLGLSPRQYLELVPGGARRVAELARSDITARPHHTTTTMSKEGRR